MISIDTLRRDRLSRYDPASETRTAFLDQMMTEGLALDDFRTTTNWTYPSITATLAGTYCEDLGFAPYLLSDGSNRFEWVPDDLDFLPDWLGATGMTTQLISTSPWFAPSMGLATHFQTHDNDESWTAAEVNELALQAVDTLLSEDAPWYLHLHYVEPHAPYDPPNHYIERPKGKMNTLDWDLTTYPGLEDMTEAYDSLTLSEQSLIRDWLNALYNGEVEELDDALENLFSDLQDRGALEDTLVVVWSDHGEAFYEHGAVQHGSNLYSEETAGIALFWAADIAAPHSWTDITSSVDIVPSVLEIMDLPTPSSADWSGLPVGNQTPDVVRLAHRLNREVTSQSLDLGDSRLIYSWLGEVELYHLDVDPGELENLATFNPDEAEQLWTLLEPSVEKLDAIFEGYSPTPPTF